MPKTLTVLTFNQEIFVITFNPNEEFCYEFTTMPLTFELPEARQSGKFRSLEDCFRLIAPWVTNTEL
jgi:hypothetical protein